MIETINKTTDGKGLPVYVNSMQQEVYRCVREYTIARVYNTISDTVEAFKDIEG